MRLAVAVVVACGCHDYDPVAEIPHREVPDTATAVRMILDETAPPRVYAVGEYHATREAVQRSSPLARFTHEIVALLEPRAKQMVVEAWLDESCASPNVHARVQGVNGPPGTQTDLDNLVAANQRLQIETHGLPMTCIEHHAMFDPVGRVDYLRLLQMVTEKLYEAAHALVEQGRDVIVYGGALHNDLYPHWPLEELSYAHALSKELGGDVLELDLVVPEIVAPMEAIRFEPWFPLLARASPERVVVWERGPNSYVVILPALSEDVARVAMPREIASRDSGR
jgi:hypothetical protein